MDVGVKKAPPIFARLGVSARPMGRDRAANGSLRALLTFERAEPVGRSLATSPVKRTGFWLTRKNYSGSYQVVFRFLPAPWPE
jgi:hypothetical protein